MTLSSATKDLINALEWQYTHIQDYCHAQTKLSNLWVTRGGREKSSIPLGCQVQQIIQDVDNAVQHVRQDLLALLALIDIYQQDDSCSIAPHVQSLLKSHIALSRRVIQTVQEHYHANGIPNRNGGQGLQQSQNDHKLVALATLRASITRINEAASKVGPCRSVGALPS
jgi:hypothetical protein